MTTTEVSAYAEQVLPLINDHPHESELIGLFQSQVIELLQDSYEDEEYYSESECDQKV